MHIKFLKHGTGSGQRAIDYLLGDLDHSGKVRAGVRVVRGHPQQLADVIDSLSFVHRYTSGVIAWGPEDRPTDDQLGQLIDDFEKVAFAGLDAERYCWSVIEHRDEQGAVHLHVLSARVDLETGKSLNIAPPGWQKSFDPLRDYYNFKYGWTRPDDPSRARVLQPGFRGLKDAAAIRQGLEMEPDPRLVITDFLLSRIELGLIENREDILASLSEIAEVSRHGKNYISIKPEGFDRAIQLKGVIYDKQFSAAAFREAKTEAAGGSATSRGIDSERADAANKQLQHTTKRRAVYNAQRYSSGSAVSEHSGSADELGPSGKTARAEGQFQKLHVDQWVVERVFTPWDCGHFLLVKPVSLTKTSAMASGLPMGPRHGLRPGNSGASQWGISSGYTRQAKSRSAICFDSEQQEISDGDRNPDSAVSEDSADRSAVQPARNAFDRAIAAAERSAAEIGRASGKLNAANKQLAAVVAERISRGCQIDMQATAERSSTPLEPPAPQRLAPPASTKDPGQ